MLFLVITALSLVVPAAIVAYGVKRNRRYKQQAYRAVHEGLAEVGLMLRVRDLHNWNARGVFRGVDLSIDSFEEPAGDSIDRRTALRILDTSLGETGIYPVGSPHIADRGTMEEVLFDDAFGQKYRAFARSPEALRRWLTPEVRKVIVNLEQVHALETDSEGVLRMVMNENMLDVTSIRRCCDLLVSIHQGQRPRHLEVTGAVQSYDNSMWFDMAMSPIILSSLAAVGASIPQGCPLWAIPATFALTWVGLILFVLLLSFMFDRKNLYKGIRLRVCTLPPEPAVHAREGYRQRVPELSHDEPTDEAQLREEAIEREAAHAEAQNRH